MSISRAAKTVLSELAIPGFSLNAREIPRVGGADCEQAWLDVLDLDLLALPASMLEASDQCAVSTPSHFLSRVLSLRMGLDVRQR